MYIYILVVFFIILFVTSIFFTKSVISPLAIIVISYLASSLLVIPNIDLWEVNLHANTFFIIVLGICSFAIGYFLYYGIKRNHNKEIIEYKKYDFDKFKTSVLILFQLLIVIMNLKAVNDIVGGELLSNFSKSMATYRKLTSYSEELVSIPGYINQLVNFSNILYYYVLYVFLENTFYNSRNKAKGNHYILFIVTAAVQVITSFLTAGRYVLIKLILGTFIMYSVEKAKTKEKIGQIFARKDYFKIIVFFLLILVFFSATRSIVGRKNTSSFVNYIASYFGGSIPLFDKLINEQDLSNDNFGYYTFYPIHRLLYKFDLVDDFRRGNLLFLQSGTLKGNVYTSLAVIFLDFDYLGVILLLTLEGIIWGAMYRRVYLKNSNNFESIVVTLIYCSNMNSLFLHSYSEAFYSTFFAHTFVIRLVYMFVLYFFLFKVKFKM